MKFVRTVTVSKPVGQVFGYLTDFTTTAEWDPSTVRTDRVEGDGGVGTRYRNVSRFLGREAEVDYVVTDVEARRRFALRGENSTLIAHDVMTFAGDDVRTAVTYAATFELKGARKAMAVLLAPALRRLVDRGADGLRVALDRL